PDYRELHNVRTRFEISGLGSMLRFQWQSHSDFRGVITSARPSTFNCSHLSNETGFASFYSIHPKKNFIKELIISLISASQTIRTRLFGNINPLDRYEWIERCT